MLVVQIHDVLFVQHFKGVTFGGQTMRSLRHIRRVPFIFKKSERTHVPNYAVSHTPLIEDFASYCSHRVLHSAKPAYILELPRYSKRAIR